MILRYDFAHMILRMNLRYVQAIPRAACLAADRWPITGGMVVKSNLIGYYVVGPVL